MPLFSAKAAIEERADEGCNSLNLLKLAGSGFNCFWYLHRIIHRKAGDGNSADYYKEPKKRLDATELVTDGGRNTHTNVG